MKKNYNLEMEKVISSLSGKPKLLLHSCCAPCSSACLSRLIPYFDITVFYYNPNIDTEEEYIKRSKEQIRLCESLGVKVAVMPFLSQDFYTAVKGYEKEPEGGARCTVCYTLRLKKTAEFAKKEGYDYFTTTLTLSPLKDADRLNNIGNAVSSEYGVKFLPSDFKKKGGYLKSIEMSNEYGLYRQNYCGCIYSKVK